MFEPKLRKIIAASIRELMGASMLLQTQAALADAAGVTQPTIGRILKAEVALTADNIENIANAFRVEPWVIVGYKKSVNNLNELFYEVEKLPTSEQDRIYQFIRFTIEQCQDDNSKKTLNLNIKSNVLPPDIESKALKAAKRPLSNNSNKTLSYDTSDKKESLRKRKP